MKKMWTGMVLILVVQLLHCQLYDPSKYSLGSNLVQNFDFGLPVVTNVTTKSGSIPSWTCSPKCEMKNATYYCIKFSLSCVVNWQQHLDLSTGNIFNTISQVIEISVPGKYLVHVEWMRPIDNPLGQQLGVNINGTLIGTIIVTAD